MNKLNFNQTGGFPLSTNILDAMQNAYSIFNYLGKIAGDFAIISGCDITGGSVTNGVVFINNEVLEFKGGNAGANVYIKEELESRVFEDGSTKNVIAKRYVTFGSSTPENTFTWANFKRVFPSNEIKNFKDNFENRIKALEDKTFPIPVGMIAIWNKPNSEAIPTGWQECTDLRGRFPLGWDPDVLPSEFIQDSTLGSTGGEISHTLTTAELPEHNHATSPYDKFAARASDVNGQTPTAGDYNSQTSEYKSHLMSSSDWQNATEKTVGENQPHNNMPPYRIIRFIEYVG